jgi:hypothetical protein
MKSPRAMRYNDLMESATTRSGLPYLRFGKGEPLLVLPGVSDSLRARARATPVNFPSNCAPSR